MILSLVESWALLEKYGLGYKLKNGNIGMKFRDQTHMYTYVEQELSAKDHEENKENAEDSSYQDHPTFKTMISYIPKDKSAQIYFRKGDNFPVSIKKHAKVFEKTIKQLSYQQKLVNQPKDKFE